MELDVPLDLPAGLPELSAVRIYQYESEIAIFWGVVDLPLDLWFGLSEISE